MYLPISHVPVTGILHSHWLASHFICLEVEESFFKVPPTSRRLFCFQLREIGECPTLSVLSGCHIAVNHFQCICSFAHSYKKNKQTCGCVLFKWREIIEEFYPKMFFTVQMPIN